MADSGNGWQRGKNSVFLFHGRHVRHHPSSEIPLLQAMERESSLEEISAQFGSPALDTVYDLYLDHMLELH